MMLERLNISPDLLGLYILDKGCKDEKNGIDLGYKGKDMCVEVAYMFGVPFSLYLLNKKSKNLEKFLAKYHHFYNKTGFFVYPTNINKNIIDDATILANSFLEVAKILTEKEIEKGLKKVSKDFIEDFYNVLKDFCPEYSEKNELDIKREFMKINGQVPDFDFLRNIEITSVIKNLTFVVYLLHYHLYTTEKEEMLIRSGFTLPLVVSGGISYLSYKKAILTFGENPSNYISQILSSTRKCKNMMELINHMFDHNKSIVKYIPVINKKKEVCDYEEIEEEDDLYLQEIATILALNGFSFYDEISKNDIITALQTRSAFGKYNGDFDKNNLHKIMADIFISILSKKCKDLTLKKQEIHQKETKIFIDENKKVKELEEKNISLQKQNQELQEKLNQIKRKTDKEDIRIETLENRIKELEEQLNNVKLTQKEEDSKISKENDFIKEEISPTIDYSEYLKDFSKDKSIVIIGGNYKLLLKIKNIYPNITCIEDHEKSRITDELIRNANLVLFKTDSMSHTLWDLALSRCQKCNIPYDYLKKVQNISVLEQNIYEIIQDKFYSEEKNEIERE